MRSIVLLSGGVLLVSCGGGHLNQVKKIAARDFSCPTKSLEVEELAHSRTETVWLASGCGKEGQYVKEKKGQPELRGPIVAARVKAPPPQVSAPSESSAPPPPASNGFTNFLNTTGKVLDTIDTVNNSVTINGEHPMSSGSSSSANSTVNASLSCCVNKQFYECADSAAVDRCSGAFARCLMGCMQGSGGDCGSQCMRSNPPNPSSCTRDSSRDSSC